MKRFSVILLVVCLAVFERGWADVFKDGETVCFLGDSITHGGRFHSFIYDYLKNWEKRGEVSAKVRELETEALKARQPLPHAYEVRSVK